MTQPPLAHPRRVLVDTSAFFALTDQNDGNHERARAIMARLGTERWRLFSTNFIVAETHALSLVHLGRHLAARTLQEIDSSGIAIVRASARDEARARSIIFRYDDKDFSLTDATSFAVMERLRIRIAFSFDRDFVQYGFTQAAP